MPIPMPLWVILTALASIAVTGLLTWILWRINLGNEGAAPPRADMDN